MLFGREGERDRQSDRQRNKTPMMGIRWVRNGKPEEIKVGKYKF